MRHTWDACMAPAALSRNSACAREDLGSKGCVWGLACGNAIQKDKKGEKKNPKEEFLTKNLLLRRKWCSRSGAAAVPSVAA